MASLLVQAFAHSAWYSKNLEYTAKVEGLTFAVYSRFLLYHAEWAMLVLRG